MGGVIFMFLFYYMFQSILKTFVILEDMYISYEAALEMSGLETLKKEDIKDTLIFHWNVQNTQKDHRLFPEITRKFAQNQQTREIFEVNWARTQKYKESAIPYCQRLLNDHFEK